MPRARPKPKGENVRARVLKKKRTREMKRDSGECIARHGGHWLLGSATVVSRVKTATKKPPQLAAADGITRPHLSEEGYTTQQQLKHTYVQQNQCLH